LERCHTDKIKTILITSALPHDGKSTVTLNLATALAEKGKRNVLLVGADLHRATLSEQLGIPRRPGLAECLEEGLQPLSVIRRVEPLAWYLLPAGSAQTNPTELVQNGTVAETLKDLSRYFDWILIDSPPLTPLADALALNQLTDATLLVARAGRTPVQEVEKAVGLIGRKRLLGIVLNGVEGLDRVYSNYYGSYGADPAMKGGETGN
jgi:capsular exopolysaccharide synthesis family protein